MLVATLQLIVLEAALAALAVASGFLLAALPGVELFTFVVFISGVLLGAPSGMRVGALASIVYGIVNPYGLPGIVLLVTLVASRVAIGAMGGFFARPLRRGPVSLRVTRFAVLGALASLVFQALTTLSLALTIGGRAAVTGAIPFAAMNVACNVAVFAVLGVNCLEVARRLPIPLFAASREE